jgi:hypothetical protein
LVQSSAGGNANDEPRCSLQRQLTYYSELEFESVILWDADFPATAHSTSAAVATADRSRVSLAFAFISADAYRMIRCGLAATSSLVRTGANVARSQYRETLQEIAPASTRATDAKNNLHHVQVEFTSESTYRIARYVRLLHLGLGCPDRFETITTTTDALHHHWRDLAHLAEPSNWPSSAAVRERLLHRMLKDHDAVADQRAQTALAANERRNALIAYLEAAHQYHHERHEQRQRRLQEVTTTAASTASAVTVRTSESDGSTITMFYHDDDHGSTARHFHPAQ